MTRQMTSGGVIPVMEMLEVPNPNVIVAVLKVVNLVSSSTRNSSSADGSSPGHRSGPEIPTEHVVGGPDSRYHPLRIPWVPFQHPPRSRSVLKLCIGCRVTLWPAANFVRHFCYASDFTRKMFVACGGLPVLVGFLEDPYDEVLRCVFRLSSCCDSPPLEQDIGVQLHRLYPPRVRDQLQSQK